jgi:hypothetical protein
MPHDVSLALPGALFHAKSDQRTPADLHLTLGRFPDGTWDAHVIGWAGTRRGAEGALDKVNLFNHMDHDGTVTATGDDAALTLDVELRVNDDPWVKGGPARYRIALTREGERLRGTYTGTFRDTAVNGHASGRIAAAPWPSAWGDRAPAAPGEHPRLLFRAADVPRLKARAATPAGQAMLARLRDQLGGGTALPAARQRATAAYGGGDGKLPDGAYTLAHGMGYGLLWQLTGERSYADLARQAVDLARAGLRDRDQRYAWVRPGGKLRAGYAVWCIAAAYDLCYDAWPEDYRRQLAADIQGKVAGGGIPAPTPEEVARLTGSAATAAAGAGSDDDDTALAEPVGGDLLFATLGGQHAPMSNHYGAWIGGGGAALLAIRGDPGTDDALIARANRIFLARAKRCLDVGFGDRAFFFEGHHGGRISTNTGFAFYLNALRSVEGLDLVASSEAAQWLLVKWTVELTRSGGALGAPERGIYAHNTWTRDGQSFGGDFAHGFSLVPDALRPAVLWHYRNVVMQGAADDFDARRWPHRAVDAFVHWPLDIEPRHPDGLVPRVLVDRRAQYLAVRGGWSERGEDPVIAIHAGQAIAVGWGFRATPGITLPPFARVTDLGPQQAVLIRGGTRAAWIDASGATGAPIAIALVSGLTDAAPAPAAGAQDPLQAKLRERFGNAGAKPAAPKLGDRFEQKPDFGPEPVADGAPALSRQVRRAGNVSIELWTFQRGPAPAATMTPDGAALRLRLGDRSLVIADGEVRLE